MSIRSANSVFLGLRDVLQVTNLLVEKNQKESVSFVYRSSLIWDHNCVILFLLAYLYFELLP